MLLENSLHHQQQLSLIFVPPRDLTLVFCEEVTDQNHSKTQLFLEMFHNGLVISVFKWTNFPNRFLHLSIYVITYP